MKDLSQIVRQRYADRAGLVLKEEAGAIGVCPTAEGSFEVWLSWNPEEYTVSCETWHEHFTSQEEVLKCLAFCLSADARLKIVYAGDFPYKWVLQAVRKGDWHDSDVTALLFFPFWRRRRTEYRQNSIGRFDPSNIEHTKVV